MMLTPTTVFLELGEVAIREDDTPTPLSAPSPSPSSGASDACKEVKPLFEARRQLAAIWKGVDVSFFANHATTASHPLAAAMDWGVHCSSFVAAVVLAP
jgi:hypothetical protein